MLQKYFTLAAVALSIIALSGCKEDNQEKVNEEAAAKAALNGVVSIEDPWMRPANSGTNTALFFKVINNTNKPDTLLDAISELAEIVEVHETYQKGADMMGMRHVDMVEIPAGATIEFKPRNLHVMLIRLYEDLVISDSGKVALMFKNAGEVKINAVVRDMPMVSKTGE